jgi:FkbM family methyltransferase
METRLTDFGILPPKPLVWDAGAFEGGWAKDMQARYQDADIVLFEPVPLYSRPLIEQGFNVHPYGLSDKEDTVEITVAGDRSSTYEMGHQGYGKSWATLADVSTVLGDQLVHVMKLNVEGAEYPILRRLISTCQIDQIDHLLIQFHTFIPHFGELYLDIKKDLKKTHTMAWRTPFVWERWDLV